MARKCNKKYTNQKIKIKKNNGTERYRNFKGKTRQKCAYSTSYSWWISFPFTNNENIHLSVIKKSLSKTSDKRVLPSKE